MSREVGGPGSRSLTDLFGAAADGLAGVASEVVRLGDSIRGYRVLRAIGRGGEGAVYEAVAPGGERVALKVVRLGGRPADAAEVRRGFEALAGLDHPHLVRVRALVALEPGLGAVTMDLVPGTTLDAHVRALGTGFDRTVKVLDLAVKIARALAACHARGVLHLDVKPANVIVRADGAPVLVDFGSARVAGDPALTASFRAKGTIGFMAPEILIPGSTVDARADVFALGMTLHLLLAGTFRTADDAGGPDGARAMCARALEGGDGRIDPARLAAALLRATELAPSARFASAGALADELEAVLRGERAPPPRRGGERRRATALVLVATLAAVSAGVALLDDDGRREGVGFRLEKGVGVVFLDARGDVIRTEPIPVDDVEHTEYEGWRNGDILAVTTTHTSRPGALHVFDVGRASRYPGWERPLDLYAEAPASWVPRDLYYPEGRAFRHFGPSVQDLDDDGEPEILVHLASGTDSEATCGLVRVDLDRSIGGSYFQYGLFKLRQLARVDDDGWLDALCGGANNHVRVDDTGWTEYPSVVFALSGRALARGGARTTGPPGFYVDGPGSPARFDAPLLFYHVLSPIGLGERLLQPILSPPPGGLQWQAAEGRAVASLSPKGVLDEPVRIFLDAGGRYLRTEAGHSQEEIVTRLGGPLAFRPPFALVVGSKVVDPPPGRLVPRENNGLVVPMLRLPGK